MFNFGPTIESLYSDQAREMFLHTTQKVYHNLYVENAPQEIRALWSHARSLADSEKNSCFTDWVYAIGPENYHRCLGSATNNYVGSTLFIPTMPKRNDFMVDLWPTLYTSKLLYKKPTNEPAPPRNLAPYRVVQIDGTWVYTIQGPYKFFHWCFFDERLAQAVAEELYNMTPRAVRIMNTYQRQFSTVNPITQDNFHLLHPNLGLDLMVYYLWLSPAYEAIREGYKFNHYNYWEQAA